MTDRELSTLLHEHVRAGEPPLGIDAGTTILTGRRTLRRRRVRRGAAGLIIGAAAAVAVPVVLSGPGTDDRAARIDPESAAALADYDATAMPDVLQRAVGPAVQEWTPEILDGHEFGAYDDQGTALPERHWDKASSMRLAYGAEGPHRFIVTLLHARSEAEGDARKGCVEELESGYAFDCDVTTVHGETVTTKVVAVRPLDLTVEGEVAGWAAVTRGELQSGMVTDTNPNQQPLDRNQVYFMRSVEAVHSDTFLTAVQEIVKAPNLTQARAGFRMPGSVLAGIVTDRSLVIPKPPLGPGGCAWTWKIEVSCGSD